MILRFNESALKCYETKVRVTIKLRLYCKMNGSEVPVGEIEHTAFCNSSKNLNQSLLQNIQFFPLLFPYLLRYLRKVSMFLGGIASICLERSDTRCSYGIQPLLLQILGQLRLYNRQVKESCSIKYSKMHFYNIVE